MRLTSTLSGLAFAAAATAVSFSVHAQSIDVRVIGTITPAACIPTLAGGGVVDYGNIPAATLNMTSVNSLGERVVPFSVACDAPTRVALRAVDNRAASRVAGVTSQYAGDAYNFGLGAVSGANVGGYILSMRQGTFTADGANVFTVANSANGAAASWVAGGQGTMMHDANFLTSWSATAGGQPVAFSTLSGNLSVITVLNRGEALPLGNDVALDGLATLELVYL